MTTYTNLLYHIVFSTKNREPMIPESMESDMYAYIGGIVRELGGALLAAGGMHEHVHLVLKLSQSRSLSEVMRIVKANTSKWMNERSDMQYHFAWQDGYGAFSISESRAEMVVEYVKNQKEHHRKRTFQEEYVDFLKRHNVKYDERYVLG